MSQGFGAQKMEAAVEALTSNGSQREPSMEEILASIRRIIEDNDAPSARSSENAGAAGVAAREAMAPQSGNVEQDQVPVDQPEKRDAAAHFEASADVESFRTELRDSQAHEEDVRPEPVEAPLAGVSSTASAQDDAPVIDRGLVQRLAKVEAVQKEPVAETDDRERQGEPHMPVAAGAERADEARQGILSEYTGRKVAAAFGELNEAFEASRRRNFDQMAEEMLRPMLQDWLDNNLPTIVERLVREDIERIARGG